MFIALSPMASVADSPSSTDVWVDSPFSAALRRHRPVKVALVSALLISRTMKPKIVVPFDFSDSADAALAWAAELQGLTGGPPLEMVHAISLKPLGTPEIAVEPLAPDRDEIRELEKMLRAAAARHRAQANVQVVVGATGVDKMILACASAMNADLIAMGTLGKTGLRRLLLGSVAEQVIRHATCPVVTVRAQR